MICALCPRNCGAVRTESRGEGFCGMPAVPIVAKAMLHQWEEPCLTGERGAGAVFFAGCTLRCCYCQNRAISHPARNSDGGPPEPPSRTRNVDGGPLEAPSRDAPDGGPRWPGKPYPPTELASLFRELEAAGAACLDLVTPSHFAPWTAEALDIAGIRVPVVWNCGGWEKVETLRALEGRVDVYLPDMKYALPGPARYSGAPEYFPTAAAAIREMFRQTGPYVMEGGLLRRGVLIRHLMLPGELENTRRVIDWIAETFAPGDVLFSLMRQYTPQPGAAGNLSRRVTGAEYRAAVRYMENCGISHGYVQDRDAARADYTPDFSL